MKNVIKAEFHKIFRSFYFFAYPFLIVIIQILNQILKNPHSDVDTHFIIVMTDSIDLLLLAIACAGVYLTYIWNKERKSGYIKNIAGNIGGHHILTLAKLITGSAVVAIYSFMTLGISFLISSVQSLIRGGKITYVGIFSDPCYFEYLTSGEVIAERERMKAEVYTEMHMKYAAFFVWILAGIAVIALLLLLFELFRSGPLGYIMSIQFPGGGLLEGLLIQLTTLITGFDRLAQYLIISGTNMMLTAPASSFISDFNIEEAYPNSIAGVAVRLCIYIAVFTVGAVLVSRKKDI